MSNVECWFVHDHNFTNASDKSRVVSCRPLFNVYRFCVYGKSSTLKWIFGFGSWLRIYTVLAQNYNGHHNIQPLFILLHDVIRAVTPFGMCIDFTGWVWFGHSKSVICILLLAVIGRNENELVLFHLVLLISRC